MNKTFYILGAGGFAREVYSYLRENRFKIDGFSCAGFLDDNPQALDDFFLEHSIVNGLLTKELPKCSKLVMAIANPSLKEKLYKFYKNLGHEFITYVHDSAFVGESVVLGEGTIVSPQSVITANVSIGNCNTINVLSTIGHDAKIGDFCTLSGHCDITGFVELGSKVFVGSSAAVIPKVKVGNDAVIGAGSVVISKVKPGLTVFGNPAKKIK
ncbi:acetyltransferase [Vibrio sp. 070316B]|uniref:acetyltransferase n=1 Tax=Vibrio sp. 070316B TaxID=2607608 RepID=UPI00149332E3|nr:acetyltransferase [Vibrio sp. 070316B]